MQDEVDQFQEDLKQQIKELRKLQKVSDSETFDAYFDFLIETIAKKLVWVLGTHQEPQGGEVNGKPIVKNVDNIQNWDDFCKWRGELLARLQPIQEVKGTDALVSYLQAQLDNNYKKQI